MENNFSNILFSQCDATSKFVNLQFSDVNLRLWICGFEFAISKCSRTAL